MVKKIAERAARDRHVIAERAVGRRCNTHTQRFNSISLVTVQDISRNKSR